MHPFKLMPFALLFISLVLSHRAAVRILGQHPLFQLRIRSLKIAVAACQRIHTAI